MKHRASWWLLGVPPLGTTVFQAERVIRPVPVKKTAISGWDYLAAGASLAKWVAVDLPLCALSQVLPGKLESRMLYHAFAAHGPLFMKLGQFLSTRADLLSPGAIARLQTLQSQAPAAQAIDLRAFFHEETGVLLPADAVKEQIGGGCVSQVYRVRLGGKDYAAKVLLPRTRTALTCGLAVLRGAAGAVGLGRFAEQFQQMMEKQLDLRREKDNAERFRAAFSGYRSVLEDPSVLNQARSRWRRYEFIFPRPLLATANLLVTEYWAGKPVTGSHAESLLFLFLRMVFKDRHIHSDLHPGNLAQVASRVPTTIVYDTGLTEELTARQRQNLVDLLTEVLLGQKARALALLIERNRQNRHSAAAKQRFIADASQIWAAAEQSSGGYLGALFRTYRAVQQHRVFLDECYTNLLMPAVYVQQVAAKGSGEIAWGKLFWGCGLFGEYLKVLVRWKLGGCSRGPARG